jgi:DNA polymerase III alpha subunit (gram-positive type)
MMKSKAWLFSKLIGCNRKPRCAISFIISNTVNTQRIVEAREEGPFLSKEDLNKKAGLSQKVIDYLDELGSLPEV